MATRKISYAEFLGQGGLNEVVISLMQEQHKQMMKDLVHDHIPSVKDFLLQHGRAVGGAAISSPGVFSKEPSPKVPPGSPPTMHSPLGQRPRVSPPRVAKRPHRKLDREVSFVKPKFMTSPVMGSIKGAVEAPTLDTSLSADKTLDELILEFLSTEGEKS